MRSSSIRWSRVAATAATIGLAVALAGAGATPALALAAGNPPPAVTTCAVIGSGSVGPAVTAIQQAVGADADGQFGPQTASKVRAWQRINSLAVTGVIDAASWAALPATVAETACGAAVSGSGVTPGCAMLAVGSEGVAVAVLQQKLGTTVDGVFDTSTADALRQAQAAADLTPTATTTRATWKALQLLGTPVCVVGGQTPQPPADAKAQAKVAAQTTALAAQLLTVTGVSTNPLSLAAMKFGKKQIGKPYQYGGAGPNSYDCSGLQMASYLHAGLTIPRIAADQYSGAGPQVPLDQAQQGDLLFYASDLTKPSTIFHVVMYVGHGNVLTAPHTGVDVQVEPLWTTDLLPVAVRPVAGLTLPAKAGSTGWTVTQLQQALNRHGATLTVDGAFSSATTQAVKTWQQSHALKPSGVVRMSTWLTLG